MLSPLRRLNAAAFVDETSWRELVDYARWCPSPHNVQPWKVRILSATEAELLYDPARIPVAVDGTAAFTTAGMGMFVECLSIAAHRKGQQVTAEYDGEEMRTDRTGYRPFAKLLLHGSDKHQEFDPALIMQRRTSRLPFDGEPVDPALIERLRVIADEYGHVLNHSTDHDLIERTVELNNNAILQRSSEEATRVEMLHWIRTTDADAALKKDGWWYKCTGYSGKRLQAFFSEPWRFTGKHGKRSLNMMRRKVKGTRDLAWIDGPFSTKHDWVRAGAMLQRMWLEMTKAEVYMCPFGPVITTADACERFKKMIHYDAAEGTLWFLIRMGHGDMPARSFRLDVEDILIQ